MRLDGVDDYIDTDLMQASLGNSITISAVCTAEDISNYRGLFGRHYVTIHGVNYAGLLLQFDNNFLSAGMSCNGALLPADPLKNKQISVTCVMESEKPSKLYIGGELVKVGTDAYPFVPLSNLVIGKSLDSVERYWLGTISKFMVYTRALNEEEIAHNYQVDLERFQVEV